MTRIFTYATKQQHLSIYENVTLSRFANLETGLQFDINNAAEFAYSVLEQSILNNFYQEGNLL